MKFFSSIISIGYDNVSWIFYFMDGALGQRALKNFGGNIIYYWQGRLRCIDTILFVCLLIFCEDFDSREDGGFWTGGCCLGAHTYY